MRMVYNHFYTLVVAQLSMLVAEGSTANFDQPLLDTWRHILMLGRWLQLGNMLLRYLTYALLIAC